MSEKLLERPLLKELSVNDLRLSKTNPRFPRAVDSEEEAILTFFRLRKVGPRKIEAIIQDIFESRVVLEDFIVLEKKGQYIVYDGNRRLTALKLFLNNNVDIIKDEFRNTYDFIQELKKEFDISTLPLLAKIYTDANSMASHVLKIHSGQQDGVGQIHWDSNEIDSFASQHLDRPMSLGNKIYKRIEDTSSLQNLYNKIRHGGYTTTFDRIFSFLDIRSRIFNLEYGQHVDVDNELHFSKICEMIDFFISKNGNVGDVYTKDNAVSFFMNIFPISQNDKEGADTGNSATTDGGTTNSETTGDKTTDGGTTNDKTTYGGTTSNEFTDTDSNELFLKLKSNKKRVIMYNDFNLIDLIDKASDSTKQDLTSSVTFNSEQDRLIEGSIFSGDAPEGSYHIQAKLESNEKSISKSITIEVYIPKSKINTAVANNNLFTSVTAFALEEVEIDINYTVNTLINEIQSLKTPEDSKLMIASSVRQLIELSVTKIIADKNLTNRGNSKNNLIFLIDEKFKERSLFSDICDGDNKIKYEATKNLIGSIDASQLWDYLNLITHDSYSSIYSDLVEKINKQITPLLVVFHNYLKLQSS